eukprot:11181419-Lingulodinium_polyedra.AAC.1
MAMPRTAPVQPGGGPAVAASSRKRTRASVAHGAGGGSAPACAASAPGQPSPKASKGRPKKDVNLAADTLCREFGDTAEDDPTFVAWFGANWKANRRTIKRDADEMGERLKMTKEADEFDQLTKQKKRLDSILVVLDYAHKHG